MRCISYIPVILLHRQNCHSLILCVWSWVSTVKNLVDQVNEIGLKFGIWFDPGMLYYSPQIWCSDDTDAIERLMIQEGTELIYPLSAMGAHVSDCPNHIAGRDTKDAGADDDVDAPAFFVYQSMQEKLPVVRLLIRFYRFFCGYPAFSGPVRRLQKHIAVIPR